MAPAYGACMPTRPLDRSRGERTRIDRPRLDRQGIQQLIHRHRRLIAACLAGLATLLALSALRAPQQAELEASLAPSTTPALGEVAVPITLKDGSAASIAAVGDRVDVIAVAKPGSAQPTDAAATVVARRARVIGIGIGAGSFLASSGGMLVVAVDEPTALALASATARSDLSIAVHP